MQCKPAVLLVGGSVVQTGLKITHRNDSTGQPDFAPLAWQGKGAVHSCSHSLTVAHSYSFTHSITHSLLHVLYYCTTHRNELNRLTFWFCSTSMMEKASQFIHSHFHNHSLTLIPSHIYSLEHSFTSPCPLLMCITQEWRTRLTFWFCSTRVTGKPARNRQMAIPTPMVPAPITPVVFTTRGFVLAALAPLGSCHCHNHQEKLFFIVKQTGCRVSKLDRVNHKRKERCMEERGEGEEGEREREGGRKGSLSEPITTPDFLFPLFRQIPRKATYQCDGKHHINTTHRE